MDYNNLLIAFLALVAVIGLFYLTIKLLQLFGKMGNKLYMENKLQLQHTLYLDESTKVVTIANDSGNAYIFVVGKNHMLLLDKLTSNCDEKPDIH